MIFPGRVTPCVRRRFYAASNTVHAASRSFLAPREIQDFSVHQNKDSPQQCMFEINARLKELINTGHLNDARKLFDNLPKRDEVSWTNIIAGYVNAFDTSEALNLFSKVRIEPTIQMDPFILSLALKACGISTNEECGKSLHGYCVKTGFFNSVYVGSALVDMYMKINQVWEGCRVFNEMPLKNVISWTTIITGLVHAGCNEEGLIYFSQMWRENIAYDSYTLAIVLKACADLGDLNYGREIHSHAMKKGFDATSYVANSLATMYNKCGKLRYGLHLFQKMNTKDVVSWTTIIATYIQMGQESLGVQLFLHMRESNVKANGFTFAAVISCCANILRLKWGKQLHAHILHVGYADSLSVLNSLITLYSRNQELDSALLLFNDMKTRDVITWSTMIAGYAQGGSCNEAFELLSRMRLEGPKPTKFALASVLGACADMAILDQGKQLHAYLLTIGLDQRSMIQSALINMYSKCGSIREASRIFCMRKNDDIISWTAMINGNAEHGFSHEAIRLFENLSNIGLVPDSVAFIGVLSACSHVGLVDLGHHYFNLMRDVYKIYPSKEHYGCMVDLLCRAGKLLEAEKMIKSMPFEQQDDVVWSTLLRASRHHGDVEFGRLAAEKVLELNPNCAATHVIMANMYASRGKWKEAADAWKLMKSKGITKEPGWSWTKVKGHISAFVSGDRSHLHSEEMYNILDLLASEAQSWVIDVTSSLQDIQVS